MTLIYKIIGGKKMKEKLKGLVIGLAIGLTITTTAVLASNGSVLKELKYNNIKISLNNKTITPKDANGKYVEPFTIDGTTYLPVRAVADAVGVNVDWDDRTNTVVLSNKKVQNNTTDFDSTNVKNGIKVVKEYTWKTDYSSYVAIVVRNESPWSVAPSVQISYKDKNGTVVGTDNKTENPFGPGSEMAIVFSSKEDFETADYILSASEEKDFSECISMLETKVTTTPEKAIIQVTNNGDDLAYFVKYTVLFKNGDNVVGYGTGYFDEYDSGIKPGSTTISEKQVFGKKYDSVEVYLTGRSGK